MKALLVISEAARRVGVSENTLRRYCNVGIVKATRDSSGRRLFTECDVKAAREYRNSTAGGRNASAPA